MSEAGMRLMAGVTRCLLLCTVLLLLPAIVTSQPPPPPPMPSPFPDLSCTELFGSAPDFVLCEETETTCSFNARMDGGTCDQLCASFDSTCVGAINNGESCEELPNNNDTCETPRNTEICICVRPEDTTTPPPPPDTPPPPPPSTDCPSPRVDFSKTSGSIGTQFTITGTEWIPGGTVSITLPYGSQALFSSTSITPQVSSTGDWQVDVTVGEGTPAGEYVINFDQVTPDCSLSIQATFMVTSPPPPEAQPNLQPTEITFDPTTAVVGGAVFFDSGVRNTGDVDSDVFSVKWFVNNQEVGAARSHAGVPAGQTVTDDSSQLSWMFDSPGTYSVTFTVDVDNHVEESNEEDNSMTIDVIISSSPQTGPADLNITYTYMTDVNQTHKNVFAPGDRINYHVDIENKFGRTFPIDIRFQVFPNYTSVPNVYHYDYTQHVDQLPVGVTSFHNSTIIPSDAASYWYMVRITVTPIGCCYSYDDWGDNGFTIQKTKAPEGKAPNLVVLVHGCCTDNNDVIEDWESLSTLIQSQISEAWEVVVWNWHEYTPKHLEYITCFPGCLIQDAGAAYQAAYRQGAILGEAIKIHSYNHVHLIGHSAGAKLIHEAAKAYIRDYSIRGVNPFIHLTFLDAYTPNDWDKNGHASYGFLPNNYPNIYSEHYVDKTTGGLFPTDADLTYAFNFDITDWIGADKGDSGHQWPRHWYKKSISESWIGCGFALSLEGGNNQIATQAGASGSLKLELSDCIGDVPPPPSPTPRPTPTPPPPQ